MVHVSNYHETMLWCYNAIVNSHQRWKQTRNRVCFHLWCELTSTMRCNGMTSFMEFMPIVLLENPCQGISLASHFANSKWFTNFLHNFTRKHLSVFAVVLLACFAVALGHLGYVRTGDCTCVTGRNLRIRSGGMTFYLYHDYSFLHWYL